MYNDDQAAVTGVSQFAKAGGDALGSTCAGSTALAGDAYGSGYGFANNGFAEGTGLGSGGNSVAGSRGVGAMGGDVSDNTTIGSINIKS